MRRRVEDRNEDDANRKKLLEDEVKESIALGSEVELTSQPDWKSSEPGLAADFTLKVPGFASAAQAVAGTTGMAATGQSPTVAVPTATGPLPGPATTTTR